jgi:hypothetical protein
MLELIRMVINGKHEIFRQPINQINSVELGTQSQGVTFPELAVILRKTTRFHWQRLVLDLCLGNFLPVLSSGQLPSQASGGLARKG